MDVPPSRYRVIEKDRRLVVIDTHNGNAQVTGAAVQPPPTSRRLDRPAPSLAAPRPRPQRERAPGPRVTQEDIAADVRRAAQAVRSGAAQPILETQSWFDNKGPRRILLKPNSSGSGGVILAALLIFLTVGIFLIGWPLIFVLGFLILQPGTRKALRGGMTAWLDGAGEDLGPV